MGVLGFVYLIVGIVSTTLMVKRDCIRLSTRTFFNNSFTRWVIVSRFLAIMGFPSLVAACTLIILTLAKLVKANPGRQWYQRWRYVLTLMLIPYGIAI